ncbi:MAG: biotin/lipoyl-binding protein [Chloroflexi bacterium]|nr:biotin/lipoyl-binding protein [Chloroflexota bacterium]
MKYNFQLDGTTHTIDLHKTSRGYRAVLDGQEFLIDAFENQSGELSFKINDRLERAYFASDGTRRWIWIDGRTVQLTVTNGAPRSEKRRPSEHVHAGERIVAAPMPGLVRAVRVTQGDSVTKGQVLFVLEAMKMEIQVKAHRAGTLAQLNARVGQTVEREQVLAEIE